MSASCPSYGRATIAFRLAEPQDGPRRRLGDKEYLDDERFAAGDLMMTPVLRILRRTDLVTSRPALHAYQLRCEAGPAFQKALADQIAGFATNAPLAVAA